MIDRFEPLATQRDSSIFLPALDANHGALTDVYRNSRVLVIGGAGSIGAAVVQELLEWPIGCLYVVDLNENALADLVRTIRSSDIIPPDEFEALPIGMGSPWFDQFLASLPSFDIVFNLSALKHVRSEKSPFSMARMMETNIILPTRLAEALPSSTHFFSVSSDKAVSPANVMGASKRAMEYSIFSRADRISVSSARFANVAFSAGSLHYSFLNRISSGLPLAGPSDIRRYFISHREAAQMCLFAPISGSPRSVVIPAPKDTFKAISFKDLAISVLEAHELEPVFVDSEAEAKSLAKMAQASRKWPCLFSPSDTSGEKELEEFVDVGEVVDNGILENLGVINYQSSAFDRKTADHFLKKLNDLIASTYEKQDLVELLKLVVPTFKHVEANKSLDSKL